MLDSADGGFTERSRNLSFLSHGVHDHKWEELEKVPLPVDVCDSGKVSGQGTGQPDYVGFPLCML